MEVISDKKLYDEIWDKVYEKFCFKPSTDTNINTFDFNIPCQCYKLNKYWEVKQEKVISKIFQTVGDEDIYALDWQHEAYVFKPSEYIYGLEKEYVDNENKKHFFPGYYPDGDYHFFISKNFSYGLLGNPWKNEIYVFGDCLLKEFKKYINELEITECN